MQMWRAGELRVHTYDTFRVSQIETILWNFDILGKLGQFVRSLIFLFKYLEGPRRGRRIYHFI